jgi:hypothetical protein
LTRVTLLLEVIAVAVVCAEAKFVSSALVDVVKLFGGIVVMYTISEEEIAGDGQENDSQDDRWRAGEIEGLRRTCQD